MNMIIAYGSNDPQRNCKFDRFSPSECDEFGIGTFESTQNCEINRIEYFLIQF